LKADIVIKKLQLIVSDLKDKFDSTIDMTQLLKKKRNPKESVLVGKIVMMFVSILKKIKQIKNLEKDFVDHRKMASYEMQERVYKLLLLYYKAQFFAFNDGLAEAVFICQAIVDELKKAEEYYKANSSVVSSVKDKFFDEAMAIGNKARSLKCLIHCTYAMRAHNKAINAKKEKPDKATRAIKYKDAMKLIEEDSLNNVRLNSFMTDLSKAPKDLIMPKAEKKGAKERMYPEIADKLNLPLQPDKLRIVDMLPPLKPLHVKPYMHDLASSFIEFPDLDTAIKEVKEKKGGLFSKIKWLFGR
jgi:hypothetical protein